MATNPKPYGYKDLLGHNTFTHIHTKLESDWQDYLSNRQNKWQSKDKLINI